MAGPEQHDSFVFQGSKVGDAALFGTADNNAEGAIDVSSAFDPNFDQGHVAGAAPGQPGASVDAPGDRRLPFPPQSVDTAPRVFRDGTPVWLS